jgi:hypothetical protein
MQKKKWITWITRITGAIVVLFMILIGPILTGDTASAEDAWRRWLAYPYSSLVHQGGSTGGVMAFTSSAYFYQVPTVSSCGFGGPGGCFSYIFDYDADDNPIFGWTQASFQMNGQYACALFNPNYGSFGIEMYIDGISSGYQSYTGLGGQTYQRCTVTRSPGYHTVTIRWAGGYLQNGWVYGAGDTASPVTVASHVGGSGASATVTSTATDNTGLINNHWCRANGGAWQNSRVSTCSINVDVATHGSTIDFEHYAEDWVGNTSAIKTYTFMLDNTPPVLGTAIEQNGMPDGAWRNISNTASYTWSATDDKSGVRGFYIYFGPDPNGTVGTIYETTGFASDAPWVAAPVADGQYYLRVMAEDWAGNQTAWTDMHQYWYDGTPPDVLGALPEPTGNNGWFSSLADLTISGTDNIGIDRFQIDLGDGSGWQDTSSISLADGEYTVQYRAVDLAGNTDTETMVIKVDMTNPVSAFMAGQDGAEITAQGILVLGGASTDNLSGVWRIEMSLNDGATWFQLEPQTDWEYEWDTILIPDGFYHVMARATDNAGNIENTAHCYVHVRNAKPAIELENFFIWEEGDLAIHSGEPELLAVMLTQSVTLPTITEVQIKVWDYQGRWGERVIYESQDGTYPDKLTWDRVFTYDSRGNPVVFAPSGSNYPVTVWAKNSYGRESEHIAEIIIPYAAPVSPTPAPAPAPNLHPPEVNLTPYWKLWESGALSITPGSGEIDRVTIEIYDPQGRWEPLVWTFGGSDWPPLVSWDGHRRMGDDILAPPGQYDVRVTAFASDSQVGTASGVIDIPAPDPTPTVIAPTATPEPDEQVKQVLSKPSLPFLFPWRSLRPLIFAELLGLATVFDRRPKELRFLSTRTWSYYKFRQEVLSNANRKHK